MFWQFIFLIIFTVAPYSFGESNNSYTLDQLINSEINNSCSNGKCVPYYLCEDYNTQSETSYCENSLQVCCKTIVKREIPSTDNNITGSNKFILTLLHIAHKKENNTWEGNSHLDILVDHIWNKTHGNCTNEKNEDYDEKYDDDDLCFHGKCVPYEMCKIGHSKIFCENDAHICCKNEYLIVENSTNSVKDMDTKNPS